MACWGMGSPSGRQTTGCPAGEPTRTEAIQCPASVNWRGTCSMILGWFAYPGPLTVGTRPIGRQRLPKPYRCGPHPLPRPETFAALRFIAHSSSPTDHHWPSREKVHQWRTLATHRPLYIQLCAGSRKCKFFNDFNGASGRGGIRTHGTLAGTPVFKTGALNHSATLPSVEISLLFVLSRDRTARTMSPSDCRTSPRGLFMASRRAPSTRERCAGRSERGIRCAASVDAPAICPG